jgi:regulatory protein
MREERKSSEKQTDVLFLKAKSDALRLLSFRPRSVEELRSRLKRKKRYPGEMIERVIGAFQKQGLLDDEKFAKLYAQSRIYSRPVGRRRLALDLSQKGLSRELVAETLAKLSDYDEKQTAKDLVFTRFHKMTGVSREKKKRRLYGFLKRRGFANDTIFAVMSELFKGEFDANG